jgi:putative DNA primase/helicase
MASELARRCQHKWSSIFIGVGVSLTEAARRGRDAPCPICGGKDRFRFSNKDGLGLWYCHGCGEGGDGVKLVMLAKGVDFKVAAKLIDGVLGNRSFYGASTSDGNGDNKPKDVLRSWRDAYPDIRGTAVEAYLKGRGLILTDAEARSLKSHPALWHWISKQKFPAMIAAVARSPDECASTGSGGGTIITCHQTFLQIDGSDKAPVEKPKLFPSGVDPAGAAVWFNAGAISPDHWFVVAEGIESVLSAMRILGVAAGCAALSTWGIKRLVLPPSARRVIVFADSDELQQGVAAANEARRRWQDEGRAVKVLQAERDGDDANDVWLRRLQRGNRERGSQ